MTIMSKENRLMKHLLQNVTYLQSRLDLALIQILSTTGRQSMSLRYANSTNEVKRVKKNCKSTLLWKK